MYMTLVEVGPTRKVTARPGVGAHTRVNPPKATQNVPVYLQEETASLSGVPPPVTLPVGIRPDLKPPVVLTTPGIPLIIATGDN